MYRCIGVIADIAEVFIVSFEVHEGALDAVVVAAGHLNTNTSHTGG